MIPIKLVLYLGNLFEMPYTGSVLQAWRSYYDAGAARIAMRYQPGAGTQVSWLYAVHLGSTTCVVAAGSSSCAEPILYKSWGERRGASVNPATDYRYTGQREADAGLYFYNARWYDPYLNRWIQPDTIIPDIYNPLDLDRYSYVRNNPINLTDPSGHCPICIGVLGGLIGGAIYGYGSQVLNNLNQGMDIGKALTTNISGTTTLLYTGVGAVMGAGLGPIIAPAASTLATIITGGTTACVAGGCNVVSNLLESDLPAVQQFVQDAATRNVGKGYGTFGTLWSWLSDSMVQAGSTVNLFVSKIGDKITGMMKVSISGSFYEIKYLEGLGNGAGTSLFKQAIQDSIARGYGGAIYLQPAEKALEWYLKNFPGAEVRPDGALYWSSEAAKAILGQK